MAQLRLVPLVGLPVDVTKDQAIVGREPSCDVYINDGSVSRRHARLDRRGASWFVVDQGSANGTYLDSQRVSDALLRQGQEIRFGAVPYRVELLGGMPAAPPPRPGLPPPPPAPVMPPAGAPPPWPAAPPAAPPWPGAPPPAPAWPSAPPPRPGMPPPPAVAPPMPGGPPRPGAPPPPPPPRGPGAPPAPHTAPYRTGSGPPRARGPRPPRPTPSPEAAPAKQGRGALFWTLIGCGGCLLVAIIGAAVLMLVPGLAIGTLYYATKAPVEAVHTRLLQPLQAGQVDSAYQALSEGYRTQVSREAFAAFVARHPSLKENKDYTFAHRDVRNDTAVLSGVLTAASGPVEAARFTLVKEKDAWSVSGMDVAGDRPDAPAAAGPEGLRIELAEAQKRAVGDTVEVTISVNVSGFAVRPLSGGEYEIDLTQDVETLGPTGERVEALSGRDVRRFQRPTSMEHGAVAPITTPLILDRSLTQGRYLVRLTVRDRVGGEQVTHEVPFDFPEGTPPTTTTTVPARP